MFYFDDGNSITVFFKSGESAVWKADNPNYKVVKDLAIKYNLVIQLVYYPPYCSKYNKIERVWARIQIEWRRITMDSLDILLTCLNEITWLGKKIKGFLSMKEYEKGIKISDYEMETRINPYIIREEGIEKWSLVITPYVN